MIYLPAAAGRTTRRMSQAGTVAAAVGGILTVATIVADIASSSDVAAHPALYQVTIGCAAVAATLLGVAHMRTLIMQSAMGTMAELARMSESQRRAADEIGALAAEYADLADTNRQMVAELARMRTALRDAEADRKVDAERLADEVARLGQYAADQATEIRHLRAGLQERDERMAELATEYERFLREDMPRAIRRAEARGYVAGFRQRLGERHRPDRGRTRPE